jgi:hypothetical protein
MGACVWPPRAVRPGVRPAAGVPHMHERHLPSPSVRVYAVRPPGRRLLEHSIYSPGTLRQAAAAMGHRSLALHTRYDPA